jgi:hypothetical protein
VHGDNPHHLTLSVMLLAELMMQHVAAGRIPVADFLAESPRWAPARPLRRAQHFALADSLSHACLIFAEGLAAAAMFTMIAAAMIPEAVNMGNANAVSLSTLIPGITDGMKYAVVAGAVAGGGLTVIANAPNPAGQAILKGFFENGVSPAKLFLAAVGPTTIVWLLFLLI